ncbi:phosphopentomutase [Spirochaeta cellobiosiphila]|uniref:phosphopentomutase n=1 Tax=Spirochaeta cellobiosiphila TaxID=504483 RepID=UPI000420D2FC|nr:phosphopentomutase [Spirochaeta cellobiosiphila]
MRATILVIDSFGIGAMPDADKYGDVGANTALHILESNQGKSWPTLKKLGLGNASQVLGPNLPGCEAVASPLASYGVMSEKSPGKDTTTGHWEIAGMPLEKAFYTFPPEYPSFPDKLIAVFKERTGLDILGNKAASGTVIINELGEEHMKTGKPICYTSADSVFQIAAHEDIISVEELYKLCEITRELCNEYGIARVIARPFIGSPGNFTRTAGRHDYSIALPSISLGEHLQNNGVKTIAVGKISDIFAGIGFDNSYPDKGNPACLARTKELLDHDSDDNEFVFVNLVDTDMVYGHRRDPIGYYESVKATDDWLADIVDNLPDGDVLIITGDHGCDPTYKGSDHTREFVPLLWLNKTEAGQNLGIRTSFSDIAQSLCKYYGIPSMKTGKAI